MSPSDLVAVLFTDLVASTEMMTTLGDRAFDELRRGHFAALGEAVRAHHGQEVKNTGDGVMAVFRAASDAVEAAVALQHASARHARRVSVPLEIRVGVALGDVTSEGGDVFGTPVVEAARLVATAGPGEILATGLVRAVAAGRCTATFTDRGMLGLKGLPEPVAAYKVAWEPEAGPTLVLPPLLASVGRVFVGREAELDHLTQLWKEASAGDRRLALLAGEPGIGKTRLAAHLAHAVHEKGAVVLGGRCDEDLGVPYQPFVEALRHYVLSAPDHRFGRHAGELTRLVPELPDLVSGLPGPMRSDPETERYRLFAAISSWLAEVSAASPVLLVLDDLQWAAKPTLLLLRHVLRGPDPTRLLIVATYRDTDMGRGHPLPELLADLRRDGGVERIPLSGLDTPAINAFLETAAGHELGEEGDALARAIWSETDGNAFFVAEVLRHLLESGALEQRDGRWTTSAPVEDLGIPDGVRDVVGRRLSRLSDTTNRVLAFASVVGLEFEPAVVRHAGGFPEESVLTAVEEAVAARLVVEVPAPEPRNRFAHALVRATLYDELSSARRVAFHRQVAEAIEVLHARGLDDQLPALAHHWARAAAPTAEANKAIEYARRAGDRALAQLANDEAVTWYSQALELLEVRGDAEDKERGELLVALGEAQRRAGEPGYRQTLLDAAHLAGQHGDGDLMARAALANLRGQWMSAVARVDAERVSVLEQALDLVGEGDAVTRARLLAALALELTYSGDLERRIAISDEALATARRTRDPAALVNVLAQRFMALAAPSTLAERRANIDELISAAEALGDSFTLAWGWYYRLRVSLESADGEGARAALDRVQALDRELAQPTLHWFSAFTQATMLMNEGHLAEAEVDIQKAKEMADATGQPDGHLYWASQMFMLRSDQGRLEELEDTFLALRAEHPSFGLTAGLLAVVHCESDRLDEARAMLEWLGRDGFSVLPVEPTWLFALTASSVAAVRLDDRAKAAALFDLLSPYAEQSAALTAAYGGSVAYYLGVLATTLARFDEAETHFATAEAAHTRMTAPAWLARTHLERARMLLRRGSPGDAERARSLLEETLGTATGLGLGGIERQAIALLEGRGH
ncbi:MAG: ATP-binding protein [Acidimicrobiia bacterium]